MHKILVLNFFSANSNPTSGGETRVFHLYRELSHYFDITLLSLSIRQKPVRLIEYSNTFREYAISEEPIPSSSVRKLRADIGSAIYGLGQALGAHIRGKYHEYYDDLYPNCDVIIHDFPYMLDYDAHFGHDRKPRVYNSHNYEDHLVKQLWKGAAAETYVNMVYQLEKKLVSGADLVFATSVKEKRSFIQAYGIDRSLVKLSPNGIHPHHWIRERVEKSNHSRISAFFIGSRHPPNVQAAHFIAHKLAPRCREIDFMIAGDCSKAIKRHSATNVFLHGRVDQTRQKELFANADIAINPMFAGAGTNLKTLEFLSAGLPLLSTNVGVRGLRVIDGQHYTEADKDNFADKLMEMVRDREELERIAENGRNYINANFSWKSIAEHVRNELIRTINNKANC